MNGLGNHLEKSPIQKIEKNSKNQSESAACEQQTTSETVILFKHRFLTLL